MKLTLPLTALVAILGLALANAPVQAQATAPAAAPAAKAKAKKTPYSGTLSAIDTTANTVTVTTTSKKKGDETLVLAVTATTEIQRDGKKATLADFKTGEKVTGSYETSGTGMTAASLHFGAGKKDKKSNKKSAAAASTPAPATPASN